MEIINLRSDTVSMPSAAMRKVMYDAEVGDDYYRADPTVHRLQEKAAGVLGKESALLVLSGTMGNLTSILAQTSRGDSMIVESRAHIANLEAGNVAVAGGVTLRAITAERGRLAPSQVEAAILPRGVVVHPPTTLVAIENTHMSTGGFCISPAETNAVANVAHRHGLRVHLDGARLFNAAVAQNVTPAALAAGVDSVTFCFSKGLGCPAGSIVAGEEAFIERARHWRQMLGGGMRQAGIIAAAGIFALDNMVDRLSEDHANAQLMHQLLKSHGLATSDEVETNIVYVDLPPAPFDPGRLMQGLQSRGIVINSPRGGRIRFVTHCDVSRDAIKRAAPLVAAAFGEAA